MHPCFRALASAVLPGRVVSVDSAGAAPPLPPLAPARTLAVALAAAGILCASVAVPAAADDWTNSGGNAGRYGLSAEVGPTSAEIAWSGGRSSLIAWHPVTEGSQVFSVRQPRWPYEQPNDAYVVAQDLWTGAEAWAVVLPYESGDWIPWIAGVKNGKVYASRSGNGASVAARMYALDAADGQIVWISEDETDAGAYDGVVFTDDGDLLVASFRDIWRIDGETGETVWHAARTGSVSGSCGGCRHGDAFYVADVAGGGHIMVRYDVETGQRMYQSPIMSGFTLQNTPMVGPDGTVYLNRCQNNPSVDYYYAFADDGTQFVEKWHIPSYWNTNAEFGIGPDGSVYLMIPGPKLAKIDPADGTILKETAAYGAFDKARIAVDADGKVFVSNGGFANGRVYAYDADLVLQWEVAAPNINIGGPSLGQFGTLVVCGTGTNMRAYRTFDPTAVPDLASRGILRLAAAPNPFKGSTALEFGLASTGEVRLEVFDTQGRVIRVLAEGARGPGGHRALWDGRREDGEPVPSGTYFCRLTSGGGVRTERVVRIR